MVLYPNMTATGKTRRMNNIFGSDGKAVMVAINHGLGYGPSHGIEDMDTLLARLAPYKPDSLTLHKGMVARFVDRVPRETSVILKVTNQTHHFAPEETAVASVREALYLDADAIAIGLSLCGPLEREEIARAAQMVAKAEKFGMPTVAHSYPCGSFLKNEACYSVENVAYATRVALEIGIDIIKTYWTGSERSFAEIVKVGSPAKVVISGGPRCATLRDCFQMTFEGMNAGASGVTYGRNIWQHAHPDAVLAGLTAIIHQEADLDRALEVASEIAHVRLE